EPVRALHHAWSRSERLPAAQALARCLEAENLSRWREQAAAYCAKQARQPDLAASLLSFYTQVARKR
ncbi:MAG: hypothetical protein ACN6OD_02985, partial [Alcaligenes sp.]